MSTFYVIGLFLVFIAIFYFVFGSTKRCAGTSSERARQLRYLHETLADPEVQIVVERMVSDVPPDFPTTVTDQRRKLKYDLLHAKLKCLVDDKQTREQVYLIIRKRIKSGVS